MTMVAAACMHRSGISAADGLVTNGSSLTCGGDEAKGSTATTTTVATCGLRSSGSATGRLQNGGSTASNRGSERAEERTLRLHCPLLQLDREKGLFGEDTVLHY
ncbi:hypothetical protein OsJ_33840 [Oryza sativa Japonica Group]|uniref:Uncharacterized protein n=1 Tax=Oryza sativa subsp. japonica TaxID=39947 RepID=B9GAL8_ORYSJ|nr:hypothetical protein OsJ_33840 [Oryza sativa Japonica Group]